MLPDYIPDQRTVRALWRVDEGYDVEYRDALLLIAAGFAEVVTGPTARSGYELTELGQEALSRAPRDRHDHDPAR
jgi:hypothetical protein